MTSLSFFYKEANSALIINAMPRHNLGLLTSLNPHQDGALHKSQLRIFSLNVIYQTRPCRPRAKTNCRSVEIPLIIPRPSSTSQSSTLSVLALFSNQDQEMALVGGTKQLTLCDHAEKEQSFPFLSLPFELRLKIYALVLPSRTYTVVTQYPHNGYYYSGTIMISQSTQTLYPAQPYSRPPPPEIKQKLTTYKLLNANFHHDFPNPSICPEILRTCKQIMNEAEPVMYGAEAVFDFGVYVDAIVPFLKDRSALARKAIRHISIAKEIPVMSSVADSGDERLQDSKQAGGEVVDVLWSSTTAFLRDQCVGLRIVDLTLWAENGGLVEETLPTAIGSTPGVRDMEDESDNEKVLHAAEDGKVWRQWEWTRALLKVEALRHVKVTWWGFASNAGEAKFDSWLGRRMVADKLVRDRMVYEGRIVEGVTVVPGDWYAKLVGT
jgi:hypothetical protein